MRVGFIAAWILSWAVATCLATEPALTSRRTKPSCPEVAAVLREATEIALKQDDGQRFWIDGVLLSIGDIQIRARDFEGALRSIRASKYDHGRNSGLVRLAEAVARNGNRDHAFAISRSLDRDEGWRGCLEHAVQFRWLEHLIALGDLRGAGKAAKGLAPEQYRSDGLRALAVAYAKSGDATRATEQFALALDAAADLRDEFDRARAWWETADAQLSVGKADAAKETVRRLADTVELKDPWVKVSALREAAVLAAKARDEPGARRLFRRAIMAQEGVDERNKIEALQMIAMGQAAAGYIDDARQTASLIRHSEKDFTQDGRREEALSAIALAQAKAHDPDGAVRTALSIKNFVQYRDDAIHTVVDHLIAERDLKRALTAAGKIDNPSRRATAMLKVATAYAKSGDRKTAADVATRIELSPRDPFPGIDAAEHFDYRHPPSWGVCYDARSFFTMASYLQSVRRAAEVAGSAMTLAQALRQRPAQSYAVLFNGISQAEVIEALARAHAASGDPNEALAWAKEIGSGEEITPKYDEDTRRAVEGRIYALTGVAEGILDRSSQAPLPSP